MDFAKWLFTSLTIAISGIFGVHQASPVVSQESTDTATVINERRILNPEDKIVPNSTIPRPTATIDKNSLTPIISQTNNFRFKITGTANNSQSVYVAMVKSDYVGSKDYASISTYVRSHNSASVLMLEPVVDNRWAISIETFNAALSGTVLVYDPRTLTILATGELHVSVPSDVQASLDAYHAAVDARNEHIKQLQEKTSLQTNTQQGKATLDPDTFSKTTTPTPTISGTASGVTQVEIVLGNSAGPVDIHNNYPMVFSSGLIPVVNGRWSVTVSQALATGAYSISVYDANKNLLAGGGNLIVGNQ